MKAFDLTPDPKVLLALTHTPLKPLDALSELIDNSIDSIILSSKTGRPVDNPLILINIPSRSDIENNQGCLRVRDNGTGMSAESAEKALKAGFTGNNPFDMLGLFGMGLNIATGKLGRRTTLITARKEDASAIRVVVDLIEITEKSSYEVLPEEIAKPEGFTHGTIIEVSGWWAEGSSNSGFISKLVSYGKPRIRKEIGRRYSTLLKEDRIRILIDDELCPPFEHCVWDQSRYVERQGHGQIPAKYTFSEVVGHQVRCTNCYALVPYDKCPACGSESIRTIQEKIHGWVGIQRYDDNSHYGIDLIRNGRAIRLLEKTAFFDYVDEMGNTIKDYPIDSQYGRIVGEVHLDHVPVDFMKQDFQRSSAEWQRCMSYLRGDSSLQPQQPGADLNKSCIYMLYQGYRRVRRCGPQDMYMGYWDESTDSPKRINRDTEREFLQKFENKEPGYYDDTEWWKLVEQAVTKPQDTLVKCENCGADNLDTAEECLACGAILIGKPCKFCGAEILFSSISCPNCGKSQIPEVKYPWSCQVCGTSNPANLEICKLCKSPRGSADPLTAEILREVSDRNEDLSITGCSVKLADGNYSNPIDVICYNTRRQILSKNQTERLPLITSIEDSIEVFIDTQHSLFKSYAVSSEVLIASEVAAYLHTYNRSVSGHSNHKAHCISNLMNQIISKYYSDTLAETPEQLRDKIKSLFTEIKQKMIYVLPDIAQDIFTNLTEEEIKAMLDNMVADQVDISLMQKYKESGQFIQYLSPSSIIGIFKAYTIRFFDKNVWNLPYSVVPDIPESALDQMRESIKRTYQNCLEDCATYIGTNVTDPLLTKRTGSSLKILLKDLS
ncbi:MAG: ATP-binding protein [Kiritimatiellia bacterium]|nr:ATP-binding protein [Fermentimonas sp.]